MHDILDFLGEFLGFIFDGVSTSTDGSPPKARLFLRVSEVSRTFIDGARLKTIRVTATNERSMPISVDSVHLEGGKPDGGPITIRYNNVDRRTLEKRETAVCKLQTTDWEWIRRIHVTDWLGEKWYASEEDVRNIWEA